MRCRVFFLLEPLSPPPEKRRPPRRQLLKKTYQFPRNQTSPYRPYRPYKRRPTPPLRLSKLVSKLVSKFPSRAKRKRSPLPTSINRQKPSVKPSRKKPKLPKQSRRSLLPILLPPLMTIKGLRTISPRRTPPIILYPHLRKSQVVILKKSSPKSPLPKLGAVSGSWRLPNFPMVNTP